jgi:hypothetical protein
MRIFLVFILSISLVLASETLENRPEILVPEEIKDVVPPAPIQDSAFVKAAKAYRTQLEDLEYSARRHSWYFGYSEIETMKAILHLLHLSRTLTTQGNTTPRGREAFLQMKQPLTYVSQFLPYNPLFSHVVGTWDQSLQNYQKLVKLFTGTEVEPSPPIDFQSPLFKELQKKLEALKSVCEQFQYQLKEGLPISSIEDRSLIAVVDLFAAYIGKMHANSYSVVTQKYEMEKNLAEAIKTSRQVTALVLYHPNTYIRQSWETIRAQANQMRQTFEQVMAPPAESSQVSD